MCGIVGYVGRESAAPFLMEGLRRLEYRGYDSAGLCVLQGDNLQVRRCVGRVSQLDKLLMAEPVTGSIGISHTRWATHGLPSDANAHPHLDQSGRLALVHNGIIENYAQLRRALSRKGHRFRSQTDTEVLTHLVGWELERRARARPVTAELIREAIGKATAQARGTYAIAVVHQDLPGHLFGARRGSPLVIGVGKGENYLASDISPIITRTEKVAYLQDGDVVTIERDGFSISAKGKAVRRPVTRAHWTAESAEKGRFAHYMLKEIYEQPERMADVLSRAAPGGADRPHLEDAAFAACKLAGIRRALLVACGTSWHAALAGEYLIESLAGIPVEVECASELRYRDRPMEKGTLVVSISQSGETADTLAAIRRAKEEGATALAIVNVAGSTIARESDAVLPMQAGPEIGVASTKAFEMQVLWLTLLALALGRERKHLSLEQGRRILTELRAIPRKVKKILADAGSIKAVAKKYARFTDFLFLGRQFNFPIALEGALKLKEISYIHADAYPSAEMKHGPIALISPEFPSVFIAPRDHMYEKNRGNMEEIKARKGRIIAVASEGDREIGERADDILFVPRSLDCLQPLLTVVPLQLLAYHIAVFRDCDVDKPRNLAKSVTVE